MEKNKYRTGDKVTYVANHGTLENGIVKIVRDEEHAWVVYNCGGDWENYWNYTGALTDYRDLVPDWRGPMDERRMNVV